VSATVDSTLPAAYRAELLEEIRSYLPAFLRKDASVQHDPIGDVKELLNLDERDLKRVFAVHGCLDDSVLAFGDALQEGLRRPVTSSTRPAEVSQAVRGPVDWSATIARRSLEAGNATRYVVRSARRVYDVPENQGLVWLLDRLQAACRRALNEKPNAAALDGAQMPTAWADRIRRLAAQVEQAQATEWLRGIEPALPIGRTMQKLQAARSPFYRELSVVAQRMISLGSPDEKDLVEVLSQRYFEPAATWMIFEVCVALRLAREFRRASGRPRSARLLVGSGRAPFARFLLDDGSEVSLIYQTWPEDSGPSLVMETGRRHGLAVGASKPDLFIVRSGERPDVLLLELKASRSPAYLKEGLTKLLGYLADRPELWKRKPAGWLVAPTSDAFAAADVSDGEELWLVDADAVAQAAVSRFVSGGSKS
jgi:hypothetical protein